MIDVAIIGGGHNALTAALHLARAGRRPLVFERKNQVGGGAITGEIHPRFRCPTLSHEILLDEHVVHEFGLRDRVSFIPNPVRVCAPALEGPPLVLYEEVERTVASLRSTGGKDAAVYAAFRTAIDNAASVLGGLFDAAPPDIDSPSASDLWNLVKTGRRFRSIGTRDGFRLLRALPMPVGDLMGEWFDSELLKATLAGPGVSGTMLGPRSAGSSLVLLLREASRRRAGGGPLLVRGGPGALTAAMAETARGAGVEIRTGASVERILVRDGHVTGVVVDGQEIPCTTVVSAVDPKTTFLSLVDPAELPPEFTTWMRNYRASGTLAKVNLALAALPRFRGIDDRSLLTGRIHIGPTLDYLEQAFDHVKYGEMSRFPWLDITIPSIVDTELTPPGAHVASIYVHYAPFALRQSNWQVARDVLLARTIETLETHAPGIGSLILAAHVVTPADLHSEHGLSGGHVFHGELALDQAFTMRPVLGHARYDSPVGGLFLCGAGTHPGGFMTGTSGRTAARELLRRRGARGNRPGQES